MLSVIIPTYNRKKIILKSLNSLNHQTYHPDKYEIIIVDDGSTDGTKQAIDKMLLQAPVKIQYFEQSHRGPAAARNLAIRNSSGEIILITGDDIIATPNLLQEHIKWHKMFPEENVAVLGYVTWSPEIRITPFMKWLEHGGPQFAYHLIKNDIPSFWFFYSCNVSIKREFLVKNGLFDEEFPYASYEDAELGYRLEKRGLTIKYNKNAVGYHYHPGVTLGGFSKRMSMAGESAAIMAKKHPELRSIFDSYYQKAHAKKKQSYLWVFIYEKIHYLGLTKFSERIKWRATRYYSQQMASSFLDGYEKGNRLEHRPNHDAKT